MSQELPEAKIIVSKKGGRVQVQCGQSGSDRVHPAGLHAAQEADGKIRDLKRQLEQAGNKVEVIER